MSTTRHPTLYKRAKTGAIQYWDIRIVHGIGHAHIVKESGKLGTDNPLIHEEPVTEGKNHGKANSTSPGQQAELDAASDWRKKKDEGYKSLEDLGLENYGITVFNTSDEFESMLKKALPQFNTDANGNVKPMLAKDWAGGKKVKFPCFLQPKLDGVRCLMIVQIEKDGDNTHSRVKFLSRSGKPYDVLEHISVSIIPQILEDKLTESFILDGEIYSDELSFQQITSAVKKEREETKKLHFRCYDIVADWPQNARILKAKALVELINSPFIHFVQTIQAECIDHVKFHHDDWVGQGYEGAMIRHMDAKYEQGARSSHLLKVKEFDETEFRFIGFEQGQREEDLIAVCETSGENEDSKEFRAKMVGSRDQKKELVKKYQYETILHDNLFLTVKHFGWTEDGLPRFPIGKSIRDYE